MKKKPMPTIIGGYTADADFFKMSHVKFVEYCGGMIAVALFRGDIKGAVYESISLAVARGMKRQMEIDRGIVE